MSEQPGTTTKNTLGCHKANLFFLPSPCRLRGNAVWLEVGQSSSFLSQLKLIVGANREDGVNIPPQTVPAGSADFVTKAGRAVPSAHTASSRRSPRLRTRGSAPGVGWRGGGARRPAIPARVPALGATLSPGPRAAQSDAARSPASEGGNRELKWLWAPRPRLPPGRRRRKSTRKERN